MLVRVFLDCALCERVRVLFKVQWRVCDGRVDKTRDFLMQGRGLI